MLDKTFRRALVGALLGGLLVIATMAPATAETATVNGTDGIEMFVNNGPAAVTVKVWGLGAPCSHNYFIQIELRWGTAGEKYQVDSNCYGGTWNKGFFFIPIPGEGGDEVKCADFRFTYNRDGRFYKAFMPRSCLSEAPNRIRGYTQGRRISSTTGGEAGPTRLLNRG